MEKLTGASLSVGFSRFPESLFNISCQLSVKLLIVLLPFLTPSFLMVRPDAFAGNVGHPCMLQW